MTASENCYARVFPKIMPSRYPSRTLRDCRVFNKVGNEGFPEPLETTGNATGDVGKLLVRCLTVVEAHLTPCFTFEGTPPASKHLADSRWLNWAVGG